MRSAIVILTMFILFQGVGMAEIYRYKKADGTIAFTDDIGRVPENQRPKDEMEPNIRALKTDGEQSDENSDPNLSMKEKAVVKILKQKGIIPRDSNENEITSENLKIIQIMLQKKMGIDDITTWQPDKRLSTPEKTWEMYRKAFINYDIELLLKCLMPRMRDLHKEMFSKMSQEKLKQMGKEMRPIKKVESEEGFAKYSIKREQTIKGEAYDITYDIYFTNVFGEWRIEQI